MEQELQGFPPPFQETVKIFENYSKTCEVLKSDVILYNPKNYSTDPLNPHIKHTHTLIRLKIYFSFLALEVLFDDIFGLRFLAIVL